MDIDGVDLVIQGSDRTSVSLLTRSWLEDGRLIGTQVHPDFPGPVATSIRVAVSQEAGDAAIAGFDSFHAQIDEEDHEGTLSSTSVALADGFSVHDYRATLGGAQYRVFAIDDPFPLLLIPVVVGVCAAAAAVRHLVAMNQFRELARDCMSRGGTPTIVDDSGASVAFDGRVKVSFSGRVSFTCVMPQATDRH
jgi:hypothetical protein